MFWVLRLAVVAAGMAAAAAAASGSSKDGILVKAGDGINAVVFGKLGQRVAAIILKYQDREPWSLCSETNSETNTASCQIVFRVPYSNSGNG
jgi:hypothetical protein